MHQKQERPSQRPPRVSGHPPEDGSSPVETRLESLRFLLAASQVLVCVVAFFAAYHLRFWLLSYESRPRLAQSLVAGSLMTLLTSLALQLRAPLKDRRQLGFAGELRALGEVLAATVGVTFVLYALFAGSPYSRAVLLAYAPVAGAALFGVRLLARRLPGEDVPASRLHRWVPARARDAAPGLGQVMLAGLHGPSWVAMAAVCLPVLVARLAIVLRAQDGDLFGWQILSGAGADLLFLVWIAAAAAL